MKDALWNRIRAINDEALKGDTPPKEAGKGNQFLDDFKGALAQQRQAETEASPVEAGQHDVVTTLKAELALQENFLHYLFLNCLLREEQVSPDVLGYLEAINEMLTASWHFFKGLDVAGGGTAEYEIEDIEAYLHKINLAAHKAFETFSDSREKPGDSERLTKLHSMLLRRRDTLDDSL